MRGQAIVDARGARSLRRRPALAGRRGVCRRRSTICRARSSPWTRPPTSLVHVSTALRRPAAPRFTTRWRSPRRSSSGAPTPRAALVVISDGADTASDRTLQQARDVIRRSDPFVYAIAIDAPDARDEHPRQPGRAARDHRPERRLHRSRARAPQIWDPPPSASPTSSTSSTPRLHAGAPARRLMAHDPRPVRTANYLARARRGYFAEPPGSKRARVARRCSDGCLRGVQARHDH